MKEGDIAYEDGTEFNEGLAKYIEYRLTYVLNTRQPSDDMWRIQGFRGYADLSSQRAELVKQMQRMLSGKVNVNNDPYGASPSRMRLYYSGMAIAALLDRLSTDWHDRILEPDTTLTGLVQTALATEHDKLQQCAAELCQGERYEQLVREKTELRQKGNEYVRDLLARIQQGPHTALVINYSDLDNPDVAMSFTPFGILPAGEDRAIFRLVPVSAHIGPEMKMRQTQPAPLLRDQQQKQLTFQLAERLSRQDLLTALGLSELTQEPVNIEKLELPGAVLEKVRAVISWDEPRILVRLTK